MRVRKSFAVVMMGISLVVTVAAWAQQPTPAGRPVRPSANPATGQREEPTQGRSADQLLGGCIAIANQKEVALAEFALKKSKHQDVQEFAQNMIRDHRALATKLQRFSPDAGADQPVDSSRNPKSPSRSEARTEAGTGVETAAGQRAANNQIQQTEGTRPQAERNSSSIDVLQIDREVAQECLKNEKEWLGKKSGAEFDKCFIGIELASHAGMKNRLAVYQRHVSPELQQVLMEGRETTQKHLDHAEVIMKQLSDTSGDSTSSTTRGRNETRDDSRQNN